MLPNLQDVFDLPFHMARDQIEESLRTKMSSIKVSPPFTYLFKYIYCIFSKILSSRFSRLFGSCFDNNTASIMSKHLAKSERPRESIISSPAEESIHNSWVYMELWEYETNVDDGTVSIFGMKIDSVGCMQR
ncbi:hypothetical protein NC653_040421 [Populus alba x Populus x berolinensis]|uniref:Uncharacterized protein n=1 Tax=Populus alba x Populus x berolinensis TaxID=444605 RepID=A0AAD6LDS0_9ROSI|nr:hypothetical protein NC653_040421 [Populus alba x Populus x berolinensis]